MQSNGALTLPEPDEIALAHSQQLLKHIQQQLLSAPISFAEYMHLALYQPGLGYYMAGAQGDFITAPEVSPLFGQCVAAQCLEVLQQLKTGSVLELGAGSGRLAASVLNAMQDAPPEHYFILEPSAELQKRQAEFLQQTLAPTLFNRVQWLDALPQGFVGICIANEVMDALPVEVFSKQDSQTQQLCVQATGEGLEFVQREAPGELRALVAAMEDELGYTFADGYRSEVCALLQPWVHSLANMMTKGVVLLSDYGYPRQEFYMPERVTGTLACYYQHHFHDDVFFHPGLQDITAHVDFTRVVEAGSEAGMALLGYTSQTGFL